MDFLVLDNDGETLDRYTIITEDGEMFASSERPYSPMGVGMGCGNVFEPAYSNHKSFKDLLKNLKDFKHLGKKVAYDSLPDQVKKYVDYLSESN